MRHKPIIVFDSGIGGISIYRPLRKALPTEIIIYLSDPANFPYGTKSATWLDQRFKELALEFERLEPKLVVLACNTATTNIIERLRKSLSCRVVGVEPVIKPLSKHSSALALMTSLSSTSDKTKKLLDQYGQHVQIYCPIGLASAIEYNNIEQVKKNIHEIKKIVQKNEISAVGLSCTHYSLILDELQKSMPSVVFIDPTQAVVKEVIRVLKSNL